MTDTMPPATPTDDVPRKAPSPAYVPRTLEHDGTPDEGVVHLCSGIRIPKCDFTQVTLKRIRFTDELRCMRINDQNWGPGGDEVSANDNHWTETGRSWPACYVVKAPITLSVKVELGPSKARAAVCKLLGKGTFSVDGGKSYELTFESVEQNVGPGEQVFEVRAQANGQPQSIDELGVFRGTIDWELGPPGGQTVKATASSKHELFTCHSGKGGSVHYGGGWNNADHVAKADEAVNTFLWVVWAEKVEGDPNERIRIQAVVRRLVP